MRKKVKEATKGMTGITAEKKLVMKMVVRMKA